MDVPPRKANGMQKFYNKIMHKIEDFPQHLKLHKSLSSGNSTITSKLPPMEPPPPPPRPPRANKRRMSRSVEPPSYENVVREHIDSEDEMRKSLKCDTSLEDEIFEELEKAANDEAKLNAAIQNFDKIISEYNDRSITEAIEQFNLVASTRMPPRQGSNVSAKSLSLYFGPSQSSQVSRIPVPGALQKSKTCSTIEYNRVPKPPRAFQVKALQQDPSADVTKSLTGLNDVKLTINLSEYREANKPRNYNTYKVKEPLTLSKSVEKISPVQKKILAKAVSVTELSKGVISKIPVKAATKTPQTAIVKPLNSTFLSPLSKITKSVSTKNIAIAVPLSLPKSSSPLKDLPSPEKKRLHMSTTSINKIPATPMKKLPSSPLKSAVSELTLNKPISTRKRVPDVVAPQQLLRSVAKSTTALSKLPTDEVDCAKLRDFKRTTSKPILAVSKMPAIKHKVAQAAIEVKPPAVARPKLVISKEPAGGKKSVVTTPPKPRARTTIPQPPVTVATPEKGYQSDCSDDSGHISNGTDDISNQATPPGDKITGTLLEKFESSPLPAPQKRASELIAASNSLQKGTSNKINQADGASKTHKMQQSKVTSAKQVVNSSVAATANGNGSAAAKQSIIKRNELVKNGGKVKTKLAAQPTVAPAGTMEVFAAAECDQVLFRSGVLSQLEAKRDELLSDRIIQLQAYCRGHLARKRVAQRRVQELAVRCIQRNVRAFLQVRDWPWWRLLVRTTPLLNVHRTEEQLKLANEELATLKAKLEKVEADRTSLKTENTRLEAKLSEMTVDLADEHSSSNMTSERLEVETSERLRLEKELEEHQKKFRALQESSEKLEMELICAKSDLNGVLDEDDPDNEDSGSVYKIKYERVARELEFTKKRLQTQHEHDLEQLVGLKKQLEKKLSDAYEEVEEQRQVVGQWKRKVQKMTNEMNDLRMLLEEQNSRNNLLEKRQRKFDVECQALQDGTRQEKSAKERLSREKDVLQAEKFQLEQTLADTRLELELKEEKMNSLQRELEEMTFGGGTEEEVAQLKRSKLDLDKRCKEQEEELDEMAGQIQLLEQAKLRLEMSLEQMRKDARREAQQRDEELEEARGSAYKKIKGLECQLESEHEERTLLLREKHELERRLASLEEQERVDRAAEESAIQKLKRDLRKYKALLRDAQSQLERAKTDSAGKTVIRQLRNQLEDAESARAIAQKARQAAETELQECQSLLDEAQRGRSEAEDRATGAGRDKAELQAQLDENEEELAELMKKYSATVKQLNTEQSTITEYELRITELESERNSLKEQVAELHARLENVESMGDSSAHLQAKRLELRAKELESRLEFEQTTRARLEAQVGRHKESVERAQSEISVAKNKELQAQEAAKKAQKCLRELKEEFHTISNREQEATLKRKELEKRLETAEAEAASARGDLRLALQRIADLQQAMEEGDSDPTESESESSDESLSELDVRLKTPRTVLRNSASKDIVTSNGGDVSLIIREEKDTVPRKLSSPTKTSTPTKVTTNGDASKVNGSSVA